MQNSLTCCSSRVEGGACLLRGRMGHAHGLPECHDRAEPAPAGLRLLSLEQLSVETISQCVIHFGYSSTTDAPLTGNLISFVHFTGYELQNLEGHNQTASHNVHASFQ